MILYDSNRKMIGIDEEALEFLGFTNIDEFIQYSKGDFANLFKNQPGYIYNFKNFPWIDFVLTSPQHVKKAIIELPDKEISVELKISRFKQIDSDSDGFVIHLDPVSVENRTFQESSSFVDIDEPLSHTFEEQHTLSSQPFEPDQNLDTFVQTENPAPLFEESENSFEKISDTTLGTFETIENELYDTSSYDALSTLSTIEEEQPIELIQDEPEQTPTASPVDQVDISQEDDVIDLDQIAKELDIDKFFLQELFKDFIAQAETLKPQIYDALEAEDFPQVHSLIHKLKGAAANLRIKKASDILSHSTGTDNKEQLQKITDSFYTYLEELKKSFNKSELHKNKEQTDMPDAASISSQAAPKDRLNEILQTPIDPSLATKELGLDLETVKSFIFDYAHQNIDQYDTLVTLLEQKDLQNLKNLIHKLKGSAINLRLEPIVAILDDLTKTIDNQDFQEAYQYLDAYRSKLEEILANETKPNRSISLNIDERSHEIGIPSDTYELLLDEFLKELAQTIENKNELVKKIDKYLSISRNLRLKEITAALNAIKNGKDMESDINSLKELIYNFTMNELA